MDTTYATDLSQASIVWCSFAEKEAYAPQGFCQFRGSTGHEDKPAKTTKSRALPWLKWSEEVDRQIARRTTPEQVQAAYQAYLTNGAQVNGAPTYRDAGSSESYTVGYGGERTYPTTVTRTVNGASEKQAKLIDKLLIEKVHTYTEVDVEAAKADWRLTRKMIDFLIAAPRKPYQAPVLVEVEPTPAPRARLDFAAIPDGNYALGTDTDGDPIKFYRVSTNKSFKNVQVRASDELYEAPFKAGIAILHKIVAAGIQESRMLFSTRLKRCYTCYRALTDKESREAGQGPECRSK